MRRLGGEDSVVIGGLASGRRFDACGLVSPEIFTDLANKWTLMVIECLGGRTLCFSELGDAVEGINYKMLTQNCGA